MTFLGLKPKTCCVAYSDVESNGQAYAVAFCGRKRNTGECCLYPGNTDCPECQNVIFKLVGTDYDKLNDFEIIKLIAQQVKFKSE